MIECIFTIDYELYGNGEGSLEELVHRPAEQLMKLFQQWDATFVAFVEAAELQVIEANNADPAIGDVRRQIRQMFLEGFEIGLHLHPQWYNAALQNGRWLLDYREYNLCVLKRDRIEQIVQQALDYLRGVIETPSFAPVSFRAGNWLFQPAREAAAVLARNGIRIDSSVFKGGLQRGLGLDYRPALENGYFWQFSTDPNVCDSQGALLEIPTYTRMVPFWQMITGKRVRLQRKGPSTGGQRSRRLHRWLDRLRPLYPLKFDFCRMTLAELTSFVDAAMREDERDPESYKPLVAIGHTKDLVELQTIEAFLEYLQKKGIKVVNLQDTLARCQPEQLAAAPLN